MSEILQGTTPEIDVKIATTDFLVSDVVKLEWTIRHDGTTSIYDLEDVTVDAEENSFKYTFTEEETLALDPSKRIRFQLRFMFNGGSIVGTKQMVIGVADLMSEEVMSV